VSGLFSFDINLESISFEKCDVDIYILCDSGASGDGGS